MLTIYISSIISFIICYVRLRNKCKEEGKEFNPFAGNLAEFLGYIIGQAIVIIGTIGIIIYYLP